MNGFGDDPGEAARVAPEMPERTREHELERESRDAFQRALPSSMVPRRIEDDYGVDEEIEIFLEGAATGLTFLAQLKATDEKDLKKALGVSIKTRTVAYLAARDVPVLIVLYHAPTDSLYVQWFHRFDVSLAEKQKTLTLRLDSGDEWTEETPQEIIATVKHFRQIRSQRLPFPLPVVLSVEDEAFGIHPEIILLRVAALMNQFPDLLQLLRGDQHDDGFARVHVSPDATVADFDAGGSVTTHHSFDYADPAVQDRAASDVVCTLALAIGKLGEVNAAARLISRFAGESNLIEEPEVLFRAVGMFVQAHRVPDALRLAEAMRRSDEPHRRSLGALLQTAAIANAPSFSDPDRNEVRNYFASCVERAEQEEDWAEARAANYTLANFLRPLDAEAAFRHYVSTARWDPTYVERPYFLFEMAGVLFMLGRYDNAAHFYEEYLAREQNPLGLALRADSLLFAGRYADAADVFDEYLAEAADPDPEFVIKRALIPKLIDTCGPTQERNRELATQVADEAARTPNEAEKQRLIERALRLDGCCHFAWFQRGLLHAGADERSAALDAFLLAATAGPRDVTSWSNAYGLALVTPGRQDEAIGILAVGYRLNGDRFVEALVEGNDRQPNGWPADEYLASIRTTLADLPKRPRGLTLRLLDQDGGYEAFDI